MGALDFAALLLLPLVAAAVAAQGDLFTLYQVKTQDLAILIALPPLLLILQRWAPAWRLPERLPRPALLLAGGVVLILLLGWGTHALMANFPVSRDEEMVVFDMAVYQKWRLAAPLAPEWRAYAQSLVPAFLLNSSTPIGMVSDYLPVNALLRLGFSQIADPAFFNPLLALAGGVALFDIGKRLFGADSRALWVALLVYALSSQMLVSAMTTYAMTPHMAFNLIWLAAFLRGGRGGHGAAIATGLLATGLHQLVFHPLFIAPFLLWRLRQGEWRIVLLYAAAYAAILSWWAAFPMIAASQTGVPATGMNHSSLAEKVMPLLLHRDPRTLPLMMLNLVRFIAWQHLALLPLLLAAVPVAWRDRGVAAPLLWGIVLSTAFVAFVLPYQGHGWGYRYLHPYLGSFALLAGLGYQRLVAAAPKRIDGAVITLSLLTLLGSMPLLFWHARDFVMPHAAVDRYIGAQKADFVIVDTNVPTPTSDDGWAINPIDEVRNLPDLTNRPLRFSSRTLSSERVAELCRRGTVSVVEWRDLHRLGFGANVVGSGPRFDNLVRMLRDNGCLAR